MWTKEQTKLAMAADMVKEVIKIIGSQRNVCLFRDSWYPKAEITEPPQQYDNLALICNIRHDTALYDLPPAKTGKKPVHAIVTKTKNETQRLFICTKFPDELNFDFTSSGLGKASLFAKADIIFLPLTVYCL